MENWHNNDDYVDEGRRACEQGKSKFDNPYDDDDAATFWDQGWNSVTPPQQVTA